MVMIHFAQFNAASHLAFRLIRRRPKAVSSKASRSFAAWMAALRSAFAFCPDVSFFILKYFAISVPVFKQGNLGRFEDVSTGCDITVSGSATFRRLHKFLRP